MRLYIFTDDEGEILAQIVSTTQEQAIKQLDRVSINFDTMCLSVELESVRV